MPLVALTSRRGQMSALGALLVLGACSAPVRERPVTAQPTLQAVCEVRLPEQERIFESNLGSVLVPATQEIKVMAVDEGDAKVRLRAMGYATPQRPCAQIRVQPLSGR